MERYGGVKWRTRRRFVLDRDQGICWLCGGAGADTVDHVTPRHHGGSDDPVNLRAAHARCNYGRRERPPAVASPTRAW
jgi:5-methylcytosine-specific restriction protein A